MEKSGGTLLPVSGEPAQRTDRRSMSPFTGKVFVALTAALASFSVAAPTAATNGSTIVYSETYLRLISAYPRGWANSSCDIIVFLSGRSGFCSAIIDPAYFYPDGTYGARPWFVDPASPTGWSIEPDPCIGLTDDEYWLWFTYVDFTNGYLDAGPSLTDAQIDRYGACWGWWF
jgi:hypothetical protein